MFLIGYKSKRFISDFYFLRRFVISDSSSETIFLKLVHFAFSTLHTAVGSTVVHENSRCFIKLQSYITFWSMMKVHISLEKVGAKFYALHKPRILRNVRKCSEITERGGNNNGYVIHVLQNAAIFS